jgi:hypothetical protein
MSKKTNKYGHRDLFNRVLRQGDVVAVNPLYYKGLVGAVVTRFSPMKVHVTVLEPENLPDRSSKEFSVYPSDICLEINEERLNERNKET